jgi:hypothetical protein
MPWPQSAAPDLHFERARDCAGPLQNCLVHRLLAGGVPGPGVVVETSYIPSQPYEIAKNGEKRAVSRTFWPITRQKRRFSL